MREERTTLWELAALFLRLGATAFGGPAAHVAMMEDEVVRRRKWLSEERFLDLVGATNCPPRMAQRSSRPTPYQRRSRASVSAYQALSVARLCQRCSGLPVVPLVCS